MSSDQPLSEILIATELTAAEDPDDWVLHEVDYPPAETLGLGFQEEPLNIFQGDVTFTARARPGDDVARAAESPYGEEDPRQLRGLVRRGDIITIRGSIPFVPPFPRFPAPQDVLEMALGELPGLQVEQFVEHGASAARRHFGRRQDPAVGLDDGPPALEVRPLTGPAVLAAHVAQDQEEESPQLDLVDVARLEGLESAASMLETLVIPARIGRQCRRRAPRLSRVSAPRKRPRV